MSYRTPIQRDINPRCPDPDAMRDAVRWLSDGRLVGYPTDTLYGLACDPRDGRALDRLFRVKGRPAGLTVSLIAGNRAQVDDVGVLTALGHRLAECFWPGPLTLVIAAHEALDRRLLGDGNSVAVRVPDHPIAAGLATAFGYPVTATSANRTGEPPSTTADAVVATFGVELALVLDGGSTPGSQPSTIIDVRGATPVLLRAGVVPWDRVLQSLP